MPFNLTDKIILFGSYAHGKPQDDSDIDLIVVLDKDDAPESFKEKNENYLMASKPLREIFKYVPVDLLVFTKYEFNKFVELGSNFSKKFYHIAKN